MGRGGWQRMGVTEETKAGCGDFRDETFFGILFCFSGAGQGRGSLSWGLLPAAPLPSNTSLLLPSVLSFLSKKRGRNPCFSIPFHQNQKNQCAFVFIRLSLKKTTIFTRVVSAYGSGFICVFLLISGGFLALGVTCMCLLSLVLGSRGCSV